MKQLTTYLQSQTNQINQLILINSDKQYSILQPLFKYMNAE